MKKAFLIAALVTAAIPAMASKARLDSLSAGAYSADAPLNGPAHVVDTQTVFNNPAHNLVLGEYVTFEMGAGTTTSVTSGAEGGFAKKAGDDAMYAFYLGRKSKFTTSVRDNLKFLGQENPIEVQYAKKGDGMDWGVGFNYSSSDMKSTATPRKQSTMGARFGMLMGDMDAYLALGLGSTATGHNAITALGVAASADAKYTGTTGYKLGFKKKNERGYTWYVEHYSDGMKYENSAAPTLDGAKTDTFNIRLGAIRETKVDIGSFFYGMEYQTDKLETKGATGALVGANSKTEVSKLPLFVGMELEAASWMILRGSFRQNIILGSTKTETNGVGEADTISNDTEVAAGVGMKFGKLILDTSLAAQTTGAIEPGTAGGFMTNAAMTYTF